MEKSHSKNKDGQQPTLKFKFIFVAVLTISAICCQKKSDPSSLISPIKVIKYDSLVYKWLVNEQLSNGLLESINGNNFVSLYDNSLAALAFIAKGDILKAEAVFDFFNNHVNSELLHGTGGFAQFRDRDGFPLSGSGRWLGDNAWLLIALNNYKAKTKSDGYLFGAALCQNGGDLKSAITLLDSGAKYLPDNNEIRELQHQLHQKVLIGQFGAIYDKAQLLYKAKNYSQAVKYFTEEIFFLFIGSV